MIQQNIKSMVAKHCFNLGRDGTFTGALMVLVDVSHNRESLALGSRGNTATPDCLRRANDDVHKTSSFCFS